MTISKASDIFLTMSRKFVTITSKNQITLPSEFVRKLNLDRNRRLLIREDGNQLVLTPEPELREQLEKIWKNLPPFEGAKTDRDLTKTTREAWSSKKI